MAPFSLISRPSCKPSGEKMISVIVPVYNEENAVIGVLDDIREAMTGFLTYEIIVVDDGSTDQTLARVRSYNEVNLTIIEHAENIGYGKSLYDGIQQAAYDCIAIIDGDGSYPAASLKELYLYYPKYDMIVGARRGQEYRKGLFKRPARLFFKYLAEYATGRSIPDVNSGLRIFKKEVFSKFNESFCAGFSFTTTMTLVFFINHYFVKYVSVDYLKREGNSKVKHFKDTLRAGQIIVEAILHYNPIKLFLLIATVNAALGLLVGVINYMTWRIDFLTYLAALSLASFIPLFSLGLIAEQIKHIYRSK